MSLNIRGFHFIDHSDKGGFCLKLINDNGMALYIGMSDFESIFVEMDPSEITDQDMSAKELLLYIASFASEKRESSNE